MAAKIETLIDKQDTFEVVRDKIALILAEEVAAQKALAVLAAKDPALWDFAVFKERSIPWELIEDTDGQVISETPLVNVYYESGDFPQNRGNTVARQESEGLFYIDMYSAKTDQVDGGGDLIPGDLRAALDLDRVQRLVRNILQASAYTYLDLRPLVGQRWIQDIRRFQPSIEDRPAKRAIAARMTMRVRFNEFSPQTEGVDLDGIDITLNLSPNGQVLLDIDTT